MADATHIKAEPEASPGPVGTPADEEDLYEDAGDLEFYDKAPGSNNETLYLARVPQYVWKAWMDLTERTGDSEPVQIGTLRTWNETKPDGAAVTKLRMLINGDHPEHQQLPREYDIELTDGDVGNHYVFSEEDLPGFKSRNKARADAANAGIPPSLLRTKEGRVEKSGYDRRSRYQPYYRKAIPKKTKVFGKVHYDVRVEPKDTDEETRLISKQLFDMEHARSGLQIVSRNKLSSVGTVGPTSTNFIKSNPVQPKPKKGEVVRAARIPKDQLLDLIFTCFRQYQYWSMKALRQRTQQPDSYLRQVLEEVAVLIKSGTFANHYCLSDAYKDKQGTEAKEAAAEPDDDGEDDEEEMEDVLPS